MAQYHSLGQRRGTGRVLDAGHGVGPDVGRLPCRGPGTVDSVGSQLDKAAENGVVLETGLEFGQEFGGGQHHAGLAVGGDGFQPRRLPPRTGQVHRHGHHSRVEAAEER